MDKNNSNQLGLGAAVEKLQKHFQEGLDLIKDVQGEARLEVHLGALDAKQGWETLEAKLSKAEHDALQEAPVSLDRVIRALRTAHAAAHERAAARKSAPRPSTKPSAS
jgi:hypothetical protein